MENPQGLMARSQYDVTQVSSTKSCNSLIKEFVIRTIYVGNFPMKTMQAKLDDIGNGLQKALSQFALLQCNALSAQTTRDAT
jgi:hypothetical protein